MHSVPGPGRTTVQVDRHPEGIRLVASSVTPAGWPLPTRGSLDPWLGIRVSGVKVGGAAGLLS